MTMFWDREGKPIADEQDGVLAWARKFEDAAYRIVAVDQDAPGTPMVSTIWQGMDLNSPLTPSLNPAIFETAYLEPVGSGEQGNVVERVFSETEEGALFVHNQMCQERLGRPALGDGVLKEKIVLREREGKSNG